MLDLPPFGDPRVLFPVPVEEASGVAVAGDRLLLVEDSGRPAQVVVLGRDGREQQRLDVGARNVDWEDLALADGDLWIADTGDNRRRRDEVQVHRLPLEGGPVTTYRFTRAEPVDVEALLVLDGEVALVGKGLLGGPVLTAPLDASAPQELREVASVRLPLVTGGAVSPDGATVLLRTYDALHEWRWQGDVASTFAVEPVRSPLPPAPQGEAVAYDGPDAVVVVSEREGAPVHRLVRGAPTPAVVPEPVPVEPARPVVPLALGAALVVVGLLLRRALRRRR